MTERSQATETPCFAVGLLRRSCRTCSATPTDWAPNRPPISCCNAGSSGPLEDGQTQGMRANVSVTPGIMCRNAIQSWMFGAALNKLEAVQAVLVSVVQAAIGSGALVGGQAVDHQVVERITLHPRDWNAKDTTEDWFIDVLFKNGAERRIEAGEC